jgi:hypothetical protein
MKTMLPPRPQAAGGVDQGHDPSAVGTLLTHYALSRPDSWTHDNREELGKHVADVRSWDNSQQVLSAFVRDSLTKDNPDPYATLVGDFIRNPPRESRDERFKAATKETLDRLGELTPGAIGQLNMVTHDADTWVLSPSPTAHAFYSFDHHFISMNSNLSALDFEDKARSCVHGRWFSAADESQIHGTNVQLTHEYGHHLDSLLTDEEHGAAIDIVAKYLGVDSYDSPESLVADHKHRLARRPAAATFDTTRLIQVDRFRADWDAVERRRIGAEPEQPRREGPAS